MSRWSCESAARAQPTLGEDGARCALVHRVPLVVAGTPLFDPFDEFATRTIDRTYDVVDACEQAVEAPIASLGERATAVLHDVLGPSTAADRATAVVHRTAHGLNVQIRNGEAMSKDERSRAAVRIVMALRELDPFSVRIDVAVSDL